MALSFAPNSDPACGSTLTIGWEERPGYALWQVDVEDPDLPIDEDSPVRMRLILPLEDALTGDTIIEGEMLDWDGTWFQFSDNLTSTDLGVIQGAGDFLFIPVTQTPKDYTIQASQFNPETGAWSVPISCTVTADLSATSFVSLDRIKAWATD